jgi:dsRNA-specific ribonuclease
METTVGYDGDLRRERGEESLVFNPFNPRNRALDIEFVRSMLRDHGVTYVPRNTELYQRAFVHKSYVKRPAIENNRNGITIAPRPHDCLPLNTRSNERLEFLGDGVLELVTKWYLYRRFPKADEGFMTEKKIQLVKNEAIGRLAHTLGMQRWYIMSRHAEEKKTRTNLKKLGCLFEAFLGALFLDADKVSCAGVDAMVSTPAPKGAGFQLVQTFIESVLEKHVDWVALVQNDDNYKNILQVIIQKQFKVTPTYVQVDASDDTGFRMAVTLYIGSEYTEVLRADAASLDRYSDYQAMHREIEETGRILVCLGESEHKIKKKAEQEACRLAIAALARFGAEPESNSAS